MLVVLRGIPITAPCEAALGKKAVAQIILVDLISEILTAVGIDFTAGWGDIVTSVSVPVKNHIGIIVGVDIDGKSVGVFGQTGCAVNDPVVKAGSIIFRHGGGIISAILVDQADALEPVFIAVKLVENFCHILRNGFVADQFAGLFLTIKVNVLKSHII